MQLEQQYLDGTLSLLGEARVGNNEVQQAVLKRFEELVDQLPTLPLYLLHVFCAEDTDAYIRQLAGLQLKNLLPRVIKGQQMDVMAVIAEHIVPTTRSELPSVRHTAASIISALASQLDSLQDHWPVLIPTLLADVTTGGTACLGALEALHHIAEDAPHKLTRSGTDSAGRPLFAGLMEAWVTIIGQPTVPASAAILALSTLGAMWTGMPPLMAHAVPSIISAALARAPSALSPDAPEELAVELLHLLQDVADTKLSALFPMQRGEQATRPNHMPAVLDFVCPILAAQHLAERTRRAAARFLDLLTFNKRPFELQRLSAADGGAIKERLPTIALQLCGAVVYTPDDIEDIDTVVARETSEASTRSVNPQTANETQDADGVLRKPALEALDGLIASYPTDLSPVVGWIAEALLSANSIASLPQEIAAVVPQDLEAVWPLHEAGIVIVGLVNKTASHTIDEVVVERLFSLIDPTSGEHPFVQGVACWTLGKVTESRHQDPDFIARIVDATVTLAGATRFTKAQRGAVSLVAEMTDAAQAGIAPHVARLTAMFTETFRTAPRYTLVPLSDCVITVFNAASPHLDATVLPAVETLCQAMTARMDGTPSADGGEWVETVDALGAVALALAPAFASSPSLAPYLARLFERCGWMVQTNAALATQGLNVDFHLLRDPVAVIATAVQAAGPVLPTLFPSSNLLTVVEAAISVDVSAVRSEALALLSDALETGGPDYLGREGLARVYGANSSVMSLLSSIIGDADLPDLNAATSAIWHVYRMLQLPQLSEVCSDAFLEAVARVLGHWIDMTADSDLLTNAGLVLGTILTGEAGDAVKAVALDVLADSFDSILGALADGTDDDASAGLLLMTRLFTQHGSMLMARDDINSNIQWLLRLMGAALHLLPQDDITRVQWLAGQVRAWVEAQGLSWGPWLVGHVGEETGGRILAMVG